LLFSIGVSLFGSATVLTLALISSTSTDTIVWQKPLIGSLFILICATGIIAAFKPQKCSGSSHSRQQQEPVTAPSDNGSVHVASAKLKGHHPDCGKFTVHTIMSGNRVFCAACVGLLLGASIAIACAVLYFFALLEMGTASFWAVIVGQAGALVGLAQLRFKSYARSAANTAFVVGSFLTLAGIDNLLSNIYADLFVLALIVFWLFTRISTSQWDHSRTCRECSLPCTFKER